MPDTRPVPDTVATFATYDATVVLRGLFLIVLVVCGNHIGTTLSCQTQHVLAHNMAAKHGVVIMTLYFALMLASNQAPEHPGRVFAQTLVIWVAFVLFTKMTLGFTAVAFGLLGLAYVSTTFITYYKHKDEQAVKAGTPRTHSTRVQQLHQATNALLVAAALVTAVGFALYFRKQHTEHAHHWSTSTFLFGAVKCARV